MNVVVNEGAAIKSHTTIRMILGACTLVATSLGLTSTAGASYNATAAVNYANYWVMGYNSNYPQFGQDCTNFVSQALVAGGLPWVTGDGQWGALNLWWDIPATTPANITLIYVLGRQYSNTATVAYDLYQYLKNTGAGTLEGSFSYSSGNLAPSEPSSNIHPGDVFFYNFGGTAASGIDHSTFDVVTSGHDSLNNAFVGTLADEHSAASGTGRQNIFWTLKPENIIDGNPWQYTTIWYIHI